MASGEQHDFIGVTAGCGVFVAGALVSSESLAIAGVATALGTLYLSPDLDCRYRKAKSWHRWNRLKLGWYWDLYAGIIPHHRHWLSHSPIVSTALRAVFLLWPMVVFPFKINFGFQLGILAGLELATLIHLRLDRLI